MATIDARRIANGRGLEWAARAGFVGQAAIYAVVGLLAIQVPLGLGGEATDRGGALREVASQPFGEALVVALAAALSAYALWRLAQAALDTEGKGRDAKGWGERALSAGKGLVAAALAATAVGILLGSGGGGSEQQETARLLGLPGGPWLVGAAGVGFLAAGAYNAWRSVTRSFRDKLREERLADGVRGWALGVGVAGHAARGAVFALIGVFLVKAALEFDPNEAVGLDGALRRLAQQPYGEALLFLVAAGLLAYAAWCLVQARYRRL